MIDPNRKSLPRLQERDVQVLCGLFESRVLTISQTAAIYFSGKREMAKKRLAKLKAGGLIVERGRKPNEPSILRLTAAGSNLLRRQGRLDAYPKLTGASKQSRFQVSDLTLRHELDVLDVKAAFYDAVRSRPYLSIECFSTWPRLHAFEIRSRNATVLVRPDAFIQIRERDRDGRSALHSFYLEVDRSTESLSTLAAKAAAYRQYSRSGANGETPNTHERAQHYPFRVLFVLKTAQRRESVAHRLLAENPPIRTQAWLSTIEMVKRDAAAPIWLRPIDYIVCPNTCFATQASIFCDLFTR